MKKLLLALFALSIVHAMDKGFYDDVPSECDHTYLCGAAPRMYREGYAYPSDFYLNVTPDTQIKPNNKENIIALPCNLDLAQLKDDDYEIKTKNIAYFVLTRIQINHAAQVERQNFDVQNSNPWVRNMDFQGYASSSQNMADRHERLPQEAEELLKQQFTHLNTEEVGFVLGCINGSNGMPDLYWSRHNYAQPLILKVTYEYLPTIIINILKQGLKK